MFYKIVAHARVASTPSSSGLLTGFIAVSLFGAFGVGRRSCVENEWARLISLVFLYTGRFGPGFGRRNVELNRRFALIDSRSAIACIIKWNNGLLASFFHFDRDCGELSQLTFKS